MLLLFPKKDQSSIFSFEKEVKTTERWVYLIDNQNFVSRVNVVMLANGKMNQIRETIDYLTIGSKNSVHITKGFKPIIPKNTKVLSLDLDDDLLKINFSKEFFKIKEDEEEKMLSAIIFSLTAIEGINKISIYIEDSILHEMPHSKKPLSPTLNRSFGINKIYDLTKVTNLTRTTIYFLSKYEDYFYYVPVTMINNDDKDKIEIIIEELTSKTMYETNLISYLNNTKEIDYELTEEYLLIKLNSELYHDLNNAHLIETVIYSINLSIKENYEIRTVLYMVDDFIIRSFFI